MWNWKQILPWKWEDRDVPDNIEMVASVLVSGMAAASLLVDASHKNAVLYSGGIIALAVAPLKLWSKKRDRAYKEAAAEQAKKESDTKAANTAQSTQRIAATILDSLRSDLYPSGNDAYEHRATLYICKDMDEDGVQSKFLILFARAGTHPNSKVSWPVSDDHPSKCKGFAGKVWYGKGQIEINAACDWPDEAAGDQNKKKEYAVSLDMTIAEADSLNVKSRSFIGQVVFVNGKPWGVLLADSLRVLPTGPAKKKLSNGIGIYATMLGKVIEESKL